jgi:uncharacterized lipoprotein YddW (UPF0748 family)
MPVQTRAHLRKALRRCAAALVSAALVLSVSPAVPLHAQDEVRALWVVRTSLTSPAAVAKMVDTARASGFNTLIVQIRGRADAYYTNALEPRAPSLAAQPAFDPLAATIARAHDAGLQVHAWINVNLVAGANELPAARDHVVYRHPEWLMVPRALAEELASIDPRSPQYLGRLARYARSHPTELEGLYLSPVSDASADYTVGVMRDIASRYPIDGVHLDYVRYPNEEFDYSRGTVAAFRLSVKRDLSDVDARRYDSRLPNEPLIYTHAFPERWHAFRVDRMTSLMSRLREAIYAVKPQAIVSVAVNPDADEAVTHRLQDWRTWAKRDLVDVICPMAYTTDGNVFAAQIAAAHDVAGRRAVWAGIGAYRLSPDQIASNVQAARRVGAEGIILFSYDSLTGPSHGPDYLAQVGRAVFNQ